MVSTVTTSITSITSVTSTVTSAGVTGGEVAAYGLMAALSLVVFLGFQEITASGNSMFLRRLSSTAYTAVLPFLFAITATVAIRIAFAL